jgi:hypothetical protein
VPTRRKAAVFLTEIVVGEQVWDGTRGECRTMPTEEYDRVADAADELFTQLVRRVDWNRTMMEAQGRHLALDHDRYWETCGECVAEALLFDDHFAMGVKDWTARPHVPKRTTVVDWPEVFASALRYRRK